MNARLHHGLARALFAACLAVSSASGLAADAAPKAGIEQTLTLAFQAQATVPSSTLNVQFVGYRDSRCPADVQCAWAGEAQAFFWVTGGSLQPQVVVLPWSGAMPARNVVRVGAHGFQLITLEPRPLQAGRVSPSDYKATLTVHLGHAGGARNPQ